MKKILISLAALALLVPISVSAAEYRSSQKGTVEMTKTETAKNLYMAGSTVNASGDARKDLFLAGKTVNFDGTVENDLFAAGTTITLNGKVGENTKVAGSTIVVNGTTNGDLAAAGSEITLSKQSAISGDVAVAGTTIEILGNILGNVNLIGSDIIISGKITGDVNISSVSKLTVTGDAVIGGKLNYTSMAQGSIDTGAKVVGGTTFTEANSSIQTDMPVDNTVLFNSLMYLIFGLIIAILVLVYLLPKYSNNLVDSSTTGFWGNLGRGFASVILVPAVFIALFVMGVTAGLGFIVMFLYFIALLTTFIVVGLSVGAWAQRVLLKQKMPVLDWKTAIIGGVFTGGIMLIPVVGIPVLMVLWFTALGSLVQSAGNVIAANRK